MSDFEIAYQKAMLTLDLYIAKCEHKYEDAEDEDLRIAYLWKTKGMKTAKQTIIKNIEIQQLINAYDHIRDGAING